MANGNGVLAKLSGSVGDLNYRVSKGKQITSSKATHVANPKTRDQMLVRMRWTNVLDMYKACGSVLRSSFETKKAGTSDYNAFMSVNLEMVPVYLTKQEAALRACVAAPYRITDGSLPQIQVEKTDDKAVTDIALGGLVIGEATKVSDLAKAIVSNNKGVWKENDQLSFYEFRQMVNTTDDYPYVVLQVENIVLAPGDDTLLKDVISGHGFASQDDCLAYGDTLAQGAFAWVHSRKTDGKLKVSTQRLILNNALYAEYITEEKFQLAAETYGGISDVYLSPTVTTAKTTTADTTSTGTGGSEDTSSSSDSGSQQSGGSSTTPSGDNSLPE